MSEKHKVAVVQMNPRVGEKTRNVNKMMKHLRKAKEMGAELIAFPELCSTGYTFGSQTEAYQLSEPVPDGPTVKKLVGFARKEGAYVITGINERRNHRIYNSAILVGPEGFIDVYRKKHLFFKEKLWFERGDRGLLIQDTPVGRIGVSLCYEIAFPEMARIYALKGVDLLVNPAAFVRPINTVFLRARAAENGIFVACPIRIGEERGLRFMGLSMIVSPSGDLIAQASSNKEEIIIAEISGSDATRAKHVNEFNHIFADRRRDIYDEYLGYSE